VSEQLGAPTGADLEALLARAPVFLFRVDRAGVLTLCVGNGLQALGRQPGELVGRSIDDLTEAPWIAGCVRRALDGETLRHVGLLADRSLSVEFVPMRDPSGAVLGVLGFATDLTSEKRVEEQLREAEERYRRLSDVAFEALAIHDYGLIVDANRSLARMFGYDSPDEVIGKNALDLTAPESRQRVREEMAAGGDATYEALGLRKDGSTFVARVRGGPVSYRGRSLRVTAIEDLDPERRLARRALEMERRLRAVIENTPILLFAIDLKGTFLLSEGRGLKVLGLKPGEVVGRSVFELYRDEPMVIGHVRRALAGEEFTAEVELKGLRLVWQTTYAPLYDAAARCTGTIGVAIDITARKRAEAERERLLAEIGAERTHQQRIAAELEAVLDHMVEAVMVLDARGRFTRANRAARAMFGIESLEEMTQIRNAGVEVRRLDGTLVRPEEQALARALRGEVVKLEEVQVHFRDPEQFLRVSAAPILDAHGQVTGAVAVARDTTEEAEFDRLKDQFLRVAAHELKTPVMVIKSAAQVALGAPDAEPALQSALERVNRGADRIDRVVTDLLEVSQLQLGHFTLHTEPLELGELVTQATAGVARSAPQHRLRVERRAPVPVVGDRRRLAQVVTALVRNAVKYSPAGGDVDVTVSSREGEALVSSATAASASRATGRRASSNASTARTLIRRTTTAGWVSASTWRASSCVAAAGASGSRATRASARRSRSPCRSRLRARPLSCAEPGPC